MYRYSLKCNAIQYLFRVNGGLLVYRYIVAPLTHSLLRFVTIHFREHDFGAQFQTFVLSFTALCPISLHINLNKLLRTSSWC